jgi:hypothetical protein
MAVQGFSRIRAKSQSGGPYTPGGAQEPACGKQTGCAMRNASRHGAANISRTGTRPSSWKQNRGAAPPPGRDAHPRRPSRGAPQAGARGQRPPHGSTHRDPGRRVVRRAPHPRRPAGAPARLSGGRPVPRVLRSGSTRPPQYPSALTESPGKVDGPPLDRGGPAARGIRAPLQRSSGLWGRLRHASCIETDQEDVPRRRTWVSGIVFNVKSSNTHSVNRMVKLLGGEVVHIPKRPGEPDRTFADTGKTCRILG